MQGSAEKNRDSHDDVETATRRDAALLRALSTPHKRQKEMKVGKRKPLKRTEEAIKPGG
jgi:hypothetical protein